MSQVDAAIMAAICAILGTVAISLFLDLDDAE